ncbi:hypothetical protein ACFLQU_04780 [Verrucomicrobiota bacterium]
MKQTQQTAWIMVRTVGVIAILFALTRVWPAVISATTAHRYHRLASDIARSPTPTAAHEQTSPAVEQLVFAFRASRTHSVHQIATFVLALSLGVYCLKRGQVLHRLLMPNEEEPDPPNKQVDPYN